MRKLESEVSDTYIYIYIFYIKHVSKLILRELRECHASGQSCVQRVILLCGASVVSLAGQQTFCWQNYDDQAVICKHKCLYLSHRAHIGWIYFLTDKHMTCEWQCGCGYFPRARHNPGNRPFGTNRYCDCINVHVCILGWSALSGDVPLYVWMMCCNIVYTGLSANSQGMLPRAHRAQ